MKPERIPGDGAQVAKNYLASLIPSLTYHGDPMYPNATVALNVPRNWTPAAPLHVGVFDDGGPTVWPVAIKSRIRVTVWGDGRAVVRGLAGRCMGVLLAHRIEGLAAVTDPSAILEDLDPNNQGHMASFTVAAQVRTAVLPETD